MVVLRGDIDHGDRRVPQTVQAVGGIERIERPGKERVVFDDLRGVQRIDRIGIDQQTIVFDRITDEVEYVDIVAVYDH